MDATSQQTNLLLIGRRHRQKRAKDGDRREVFYKVFAVSQPYLAGLTVAPSNTQASGWCEQPNVEEPE
jgi:hypothetical protein